ncbi:MAG: aldolase/citrate lyase family protein [Pseudomonadota bacterium]
MKLPTNTFTHAIADGQKQVGYWVSMASNVSAEIVAGTGFDWVVIDIEHTANDYLSVQSQLQAFQGSKTTALVRPEWNDTVAVKRILDMGAQGLLFPMVQSVEEAEKAVAATRYPPRGNRGVAGATRATQFGRITDYAQRVEDETTVLIQLETAAAIAQAEEIAKVDGVSGIFFGPADIAADIGMIGKPMAPEVWEVIRPAAAKLRAMGMPVGTLVTDADMVADLLNDGFTFVACGLDTLTLARASDALLAQVKEKMES